MNHRNPRYDRWPDEALVNVAKAYFSRDDVLYDNDDDVGGGGAARPTLFSSDIAVADGASMKIKVDPQPPLGPLSSKKKSRKARLKERAGGAGKVRVRRASEVERKVQREEDIANSCVKIHAYARQMGDRMWSEMHRRYYTTPATYLAFVQVRLRACAVA